jgi:hypothetical protein
MTRIFNAPLFYRLPYPPTASPLRREVLGKIVIGTQWEAVGE